MELYQQETKNQLTSFAQILKTTATGNSTPPLPRPPTESEQSMRLTSLPPLVKTDRKPDDIVNDFMNFTDKEAIIKFLSQYQKTRPDWESFRHKIPDALLDKFAKVLRECRKNGYMRPKVENEQLVWLRVMGFKRNYKNADECSLCDRSQVAGNCRGKVVFKNHHRMFQPCWE